MFLGFVGGLIGAAAGCFGGSGRGVWIGRGSSRATEDRLQLSRARTDAGGAALHISIA